MADSRQLSCIRWAIRDILQFLQSDRRVPRSRVEKAARYLNEADFGDSATLLEAEFRPVFCGRRATPELLLFVQKLFDSVDAAVGQRVSAEILPEGVEEELKKPPTGKAIETQDAADGGNGSTWQEAQAELDMLRLKGESFTSQQRMADKIGYTKFLVHKAIKNGDAELKEWATKQRGASRLNATPEVAAVVFKNTPQGREPNPMNITEDTDVDVMLAHLLDQAGPGERARINSMSPAEKRQLAETAYRDPDLEEQALRYQLANCSRGD